MTLTAGTRLGTYEILAPLGAGGMGEVYRARDTKLDRQVAVKVLPAQLTANADALARFEREAKAVAALSHPNILAIHDFGTYGGVSYAVTELLEGETLRGKIDSAPIPQRNAVEWCQQIAKGLSAAHGKGVVHRDLKPDNVFVTNDGHVKILDFGLAKRVDAASDEQTNAPTDAGHTEPGTVMGTMGYMSPEQVRGLPVDHRSDIFAFGAILYELLSGRKAFKRDTASDTIAAILKEEPPELTMSGRNVSAGLDHVIRHCLEKDRENRFQSAKDVSFALSEASSSTTAVTSGHYVIPAPPPGRGKAIGIAAAVLVLLAAAGLLLWKRPRLGGAPSAAAGPRRVAVLPFENLGAAEDDYFADGIADAIRGKLAGVPGLEVIARGSSTPYKKTTKSPQEIAKELNARYLLTATVRWQKSGSTSRVQVSPELVEMKENEAPATKWQQPFDASLTDVFQVQSDIAAKVVDALGIALADRQEKNLTNAPTTNVAAYDAYLKGEEATTVLARSDVPSLRKGLGYYEQAVALDPKFADAWARIAQCRSLLFSNSVPDPALAAGSLEAARRAIELAPGKSAGYLGLGGHYRLVENNYPRALEEFRKAEKLAPGEADPLRSIGRAETEMGRWQDAIGHYDEAERLDPRNAINVGNAARPLLYLRRCDEARQAIDRTLALAPSNLSRINQKIQTVLCSGDGAAARAVVAEAVRRVGPAETAAYFAGGQEWLLDPESFALLRRLTTAAFDGDEGNWAVAQAWASWRSGEAAATRSYAEKAIPALEARVRSEPKVANSHAVLSQMLAMAGRKADAIREGLLATELEPVAKSPFNGMELVQSLAQTYMLAGDADQAIATLERILKSPFYLTPAWLKVDPTWDSLRSNPKFQKLVAAK
ncbi:MAG TPA: protein kinase [Thermoanaerobaculia bacterium]|jgi:serine/threonine-protein kinase|nr:protein kinase [Thermoanaerobaculia bacterium]